MRFLTDDKVNTLSDEDRERLIEECMDHAFRGTLSDVDIDTLIDTLDGYEPEDFSIAGTRGFKDALIADMYEKLILRLNSGVPPFERFEACFNIFMDALSASLNRVDVQGSPLLSGHIEEGGIPEIREIPCREFGRPGLHELSRMPLPSGLSARVTELIGSYYAGGAINAGDALKLTTMVDKMTGAPGYLRFLDKKKKQEETSWLLKVLDDLCSCRDDDDRDDLRAAIGIMLFNINPSGRMLAGLSSMKPSGQDSGLVYEYSAIMALNCLLMGDPETASLHAGDALRNASMPDQKAYINTLQGCICIRRSRLYDALSYLGEALRQATDRRLKTLIEFYRGVVYYENNDYRRAMESFKASLYGRTEKDDLIALYNNIGACAMNTGELTQAKEAFETMEGIALKVKGDHVKRCRMAAYSYLGIVARMEGDYGTAAEYHEKALRLAMSGGKGESVANHLGNLGIAHRSMGDFGMALQFLYSCMSYSERIGYWPGIRFAYRNICRALLDSGRPVDEEKFSREYVTRYPELSGLK